MTNTGASVVFAICVAGILLFVVPLVTLINRVDNVVKEDSKLLVQEFVTEITNTGKITKSQYEEFENKLDATGKTFEIEMEVWHIDENPGKKTSQVQYTKIGENGYWIEATTQILPQIGIRTTDNDNVDEENEEMLLKEGDKVYVKLKIEKDKTAESSLLGYANTGEYTTESSSGMVTVNGTTIKRVPDVIKDTEDESTGPYIPNGFTKVDNKTIQDSSGNQYVWIEVPRTWNVYPTVGLSLTTFTTIDYANIEKDLHTYTSVYRNGTSYTDTWSSSAQQGLNEKEYYTLKKQMLKSIYMYEGFYVGKYETGIENSPRTSYSDNTQTPVIKANAYPYNYITNAQAQKLSNGMESGDCTTSLIFGVQWDLVLKYLETKGATQRELTNNSTKWGNYYNTLWNISALNPKVKYNIYANGVLTGYKSAPYEKSSESYVLLTTGASNMFRKQGVYDIAGNVWEWTLEKTNDSEKLGATRGGSICHYYDGELKPASYRSKDAGNYSQFDVGFRVALYKTDEIKDEEKDNNKDDDKDEDKKDNVETDLEAPLVEMLRTSRNSDDGNLELTFRVTDKNFASSNLSVSNVQLLINGYLTEKGLRLSEPTILTEQRTENGETTTVQYGVQYTATISGYAEDTRQIKIRIPKGAVRDKSGNVNKETDLIVYNVLRNVRSEKYATSYFFGKAIQRQNIDNITFEKSIPESVYNHETKKIIDKTRAWDVSEQEDQSIVAWYVDSEVKDGIYKIHVANNNQVPGQIEITSNNIYANQDSSYLFSYIGYSSRTQSPETITNIELLNTSNVINMEGMFFSTGYNAMTNLNLGGNFNTSKVTNMKFMFSFAGYTSMTSLKLRENFDTTNVTDMSVMFLRNRI